MSTYLRKCVSLGPRGFTSPGGDQDYRTNRAFFTQTDTKWVRLWVHWPTAQPADGPLNEAFMRPLDDQIAAANADGRAVILVTWSYPAWTNSQNTAAFGSGFNRDFVFPDDLSTGGPYARWIAALVLRYANQGRNPHVNLLEVVNEPNVQGWPQRNSSGQTVVQCYVLQMFSTADAINHFFGDQVLLGGPATADVRPGSPLGFSEYGEVTRGIMAGLPDNFDSSHWIWTHHNYIDIEGNASFPSAADVRNIVAAQTTPSGGKKWLGWADGTGVRPLVFLTEGGARIALVGGTGPQSTRITQAFGRVYNNNPNAGLGIGMFANYLYYGSGGSDDSGLLEPISSGVVPRPAYGAWTALAPGFY